MKSGQMLPQLEKFFGPVCQCLSHQDGDLVAGAIEVSAASGAATNSERRRGCGATLIEHLRSQ